MSVLVITMLFLVLSVACLVYWRANNDAGRGFAIAGIIFVVLLIFNGAIWFTIQTRSQSDIKELEVFAGNTVSAYIFLSGDGGADAAGAIEKYNSRLAKLKSYDSNWFLESYYADVPGSLEYLSISVAETEEPIE